MEKLTDKEIEEKWRELEDVLFIEAKDFYKGNEEYKDDIELLLANNWFVFNAGIPLQDVWYWFNEQHSKGVGWLMNEIR